MAAHRKRKNLLRRISARLARPVLRPVLQPVLAVLAPIVQEALAPRPRASQSGPVATKVAEIRSTALTEGIRITVEATYIPQQSSPESRRYVFAYTVDIENEGNAPAHLRTRHWIITDGNGRLEEVKGPGVVGKTPRLMPGQTFRYTSGCILETPVGTMHGSYQMYRDDGEHFDAVIAPFTLASPTRDPDRMLN